MDFKVRDLKFKSRRVPNNKKLGGGRDRSRDRVKVKGVNRVRGSVRLGIGIGFGRVVCVFPPPKKKSGKITQLEKKTN